MNFLPNINFNGQKVFLRADLNVPITNNAIGDDFRLQALLATLDHILKNNGIVILGTHIGRPKNHEPQLSTKQLLPWFEKNGYTIIFEPNLETVAKSSYPQETIVLLENLRFWPEEKNHNASFAKQLKNCADYYVNDAFALLHRDDTSITDLPKLFDPNKRFFGLLIKKELPELKQLTNNAPQPFVAILGGGKVVDKLPIIESLLDMAQTIILTPAIVFTFMKARGMRVGKSVVDDNAIESVQDIMHKADKKSVQLLLPLDFQIAQGSIDGPLEIVDANAIPEDAIGISIGPKSIEQFKKPIMDAHTIFVNAAMGFAHRPETMQGLHQLLELVAQSNAFSVVGGGDSVSAVRAAGLENKIGYLSTGGGATLNYIAGKELPGLIDCK